MHRPRPVRLLCSFAGVTLACAAAQSPPASARPDARISTVAATPTARTTRHPPFPADYRCVPFHDARYSGGAQTIPGRVQNEYYDQLDVSPDAQKAGAEE